MKFYSLPLMLWCRKLFLEFRDMRLVLFGIFGQLFKTYCGNKTQQQIMWTQGTTEVPRSGCACSRTCVHKGLQRSYSPDAHAADNAYTRDYRGPTVRMCMQCGGQYWHSGPSVPVYVAQGETADI
jgi:hypothetical protein